MNILKHPGVQRARRYVRLGLSVAAVILAVAIVATVTADLGPVVRQLAERAGSEQIDRPIHIGRLSIHLLTGRVIVEEFSIDGLHPGDRPFFTAKRLAVALDWVSLVRRRPEVTISSVEMTDWQMLVEKWEGGAQSFPDLARNRRPSDGPSRFTTTLQYLSASRGQFAYEDHEAPWSIVCPNLDITIGNLPNYHGSAAFTDGTLKILDSLPMRTNFKAQFVIDGALIHLERIDIETDSAVTFARGDVDVANFPEMKFQVQSKVNFPRMREIFFKTEPWVLAGDADFTGNFHLFKHGHDLTGTFASELLGVYDYRFPDFRGSLRWTPVSFDVWDGRAGFSRGSAQFVYSIKPLGEKHTRPTQRFEVGYAGVDLAAFTDFQKLPGLRVSGAASGRYLLEWPSGRFAEHRGEGQIDVTPPPGAVTMGASLSGDRPIREWGPFAPQPLAAHVPIAGALRFRFGPEDVTVEGGRFATAQSHVTFQGTTGLDGDRARLSFHVTSGDWQESDQVLAGILTDFGSPSGPVAFGGRGEFDGTMTGTFRRPRVEGTFSGEDLWAWDTTWGTGSGHIVIEGGYVAVSDSLIRLGPSEIRADGRFSLGYRDDGGDEIDARFRVVRRDLDSLRHAFEIDEYPVSGLLSGEFRLTGEYQRPVGFGGLTIDNGVAYGEPFERATATTRFDRPGVRLDGVQVDKGGGVVTGAAFVGWDSTYSFDVAGRRIPVDQVSMVSYARTPLTGIAEFTASGSGTFDLPRNDVRLRIADLFLGEEGVGDVTVALLLRGTELSGEVTAASPRLALTGTGRIAMTPQADSEMTLRFHDSSLDPYVRLFVPKLSPFTTAIVSGSLRIAGNLRDADHLLVDGTIDSLDMRLFDYALKNAAPVRLAFDQRQVNVIDLQVVGEDTRLRLAGTVGLRDNRLALQASGDANLGILQGFFRNVRGSGRAELAAAISGPLESPVFSGRATITDGRIRHLSMPASLNAINGTIAFDDRGLRLDEVTARLGDGQVQIGGLIGFEGYMLGELNVTARGADMRLSYPEGVRSVVDADLSVRGSVRAPLLTGVVTVKSALWTRRVDTPGSILDLAGAGRSSAGGGGGEPIAPAVPLRFDLQIIVPSTLRVDNNLVRLVASADLNLRGTLDRPVLLGHAEIERGDATFEGRRYRVTRGTIDFTNPTRIEPFFDVVAETNVRVPGQTYHVTVSGTGTADKMQPSLSSDPPLGTADLLALLFGETRRTQDYDLRALQNPNEPRTDVLTTRATQALTSPLSAEVGRVVEQAFGVDTFRLSPSLLDPLSQQTGRVNPTARLTIGKRISDRVYLTFSRSLNSAVYDQLILLEYDATERSSWVLSRNEDQTYALEFRVRRAF